MRLTRRDLLRGTGAVAAAAALGAMGADPLLAGVAAAVPVRAPDTLPDPGRPAGTPDDRLPFDHIVVLMMENHSFDNYLGLLPAFGRRYQGLTLGAAGRPTNSNPSADGPVTSYAFDSTAQGGDVTQSWDATHAQIDGGRMDGFVTGNSGSPQSMGYWTPDVLPFAYSLATTFTTANRWFCAAPCQTYPNRRFLMAGTAYGDVSTDISTIFTPSGGIAPPPPNGTIFDRLHDHGISWRNYFTDLPQTAIIPSIIERYPANLASVAQFLVDAAAGSLPHVSFIDPEFGETSDIGKPLAGVPGFTKLGDAIASVGGSDEDPQDLAYGETFAYLIVNAVLHSPAWRRTLLVYTFDEHGGYYDHVPPPAAIAPDSIAPDLSAGDARGGYTMYGPRVPSVVISPFARRGGVSNTTYDHTSVLATIEAKWNLPALTWRDANAATVIDCLDTKVHFPGPPTISAPRDVVPEVVSTVTGLL